MKILIVTEKIFPDYIGGRERYVKLLAETLITMHFEVDVLTGYGKDDFNEKRTEKNAAGYYIHRYFVSIRNLIKQLFQYKFNLRKSYNKLIAQKKYEAVIVNGQFSADIPAIKKIYVFHSPVKKEWDIILSKNNAGVICFLKNIVLKLYSFYAYKLEKSGLMTSTAIITLSAFMKNELLKNHPQINEEKISVISGAVNLNDYNFSETTENYKKKTGLTASKKIVFTARRLSKRMGLDFLIKAFAEAYKKDSDLYLVIAGVGESKVELEKLAEEEGLFKNNAVLFTGAVSDKLLNDYYNAADIVLMPSAALEGFGFVTIEALACGAPVIGMNAGGTTEILSEFYDGYFLVEPNNINLLVEKIIDFFKVFRDKYPQLRSDCRQYIIDKYSKEIFVCNFKRRIIF